MPTCKQETPSGVPDVTVIKNVNKRVQKKESEEFQDRRVSPRLKNIPKDKQTYYGNDLRCPSAASEDDICGKEALYNNGKMKSCTYIDNELRSSPRLKTIPKEGKPYHGTNLSQQSVTPEEDLCGKDTTSSNGKRKFCSYIDNAGKERMDSGVHVIDLLPKEVEKNIEDFSVPVKVDDTEVFDLENGPHLKWMNIESFLANDKHEKDDTGLIEMNRTFDKLNPHLIQTSERKEILCHSDESGHLPGIAVGHRFFSRADMVAVGFHGHWLNGIDYIEKFSAKLKKRNGYTRPLALAIVLSGKCGDDADSSGEVVHTGQSGDDHKEVQVMDGSYFALKNNMDQSIPVRVFYRQKSSEHDTRRAYVYCGLYKVMHHWAKKTVSGLIFSKCRLKRFVARPKMNVDQVPFERESVHKISQRLTGLVCEDISYGEEGICIPVTNVIDNPPVAPEVFKYTKHIHFARNVSIPPVASGCKCKGNCTDPRSCYCAKLNGFVFPYVNKNGGRLIEPKDVVYECGPGCGCGSKCINRTSQQGVKHRLEIYRTKNKGWAVRSLDFIPSGAPVSEYTGILKRSDELDDDAENDYIFDIDCLLTMNEIGRRERRQGSLPAACFEINEQMAGGDSEFCIDAASCGNVSRFINHSCEPNLFVQSVLSAHHDLRLARVVLFAADDIPPMQELTYDYGYELDSVTGPDGNVKKLKCFCGTKQCRGRLY